MPAENVSFDAGGNLQPPPWLQAAQPFTADVPDGTASGTIVPVSKGAGADATVTVTLYTPTNNGGSFTLTPADTPAAGAVARVNFGGGGLSNPPQIAHCQVIDKNGLGVLTGYTCDQNALTINVGEALTAGDAYTVFYWVWG